MKDSIISSQGRQPPLPVQILMPFDIEYRLAFERLWIAESSQVFPTSKPGHASDILCFFFEKAQSRVQIFSERADPEIFDRPALVESAKQAIYMGRNVEVIVKSLPDIQASPFLSLVAQKQLEVPQRVFLNLKDVPSVVQGLAGNFALVDNRAYLFQDVGSSFDPRAVEGLSDLFSTIKNYLR